MTTASFELRNVQLVRKAVLGAAILVLIAMFALTRATVLGSAAHDTVVEAGRWLIVICIVGRAWCSLYIGGRKISELVRSGPYSLCRNPLYTLSIVGAAGAAAQSGSVVLALGTGVVVWLIFRTVVTREEGVLQQVHGQAYSDYLRDTPRFLPNPKGWHGAETLEVRPDRVELTLLDGLFFLAFIPIAHGLARLADAGLVPVLMNLP